MAADPDVAANADRTGIGTSQQRTVQNTSPVRLRLQVETLQVQ